MDSDELSLTPWHGAKKLFVCGMCIVYSGLMGLCKQGLGSSIEA